jgi:small-conductance mechanosensitive channel
MMALDETVRALGLEPAFAWRVLGTAATLLTWLLVMRVARRLFARTVDDLGSRFSMTRIASYVIGTSALLVVARIWIQGIAGVSTYLGLLSAGLAIALQDLITNFAGWLFILLRRPFRIGERIEIGGHTGDVVDIRPFRTLMLEIGEWMHGDHHTGRVIHIPNGWVFKHAIANYDEAFAYIWNELEITVTFESDWRSAKAALEAIVAETTKKAEPEIRRHLRSSSEIIQLRFSTFAPVVATSVVDSGVKFSMRYLCMPRDRGPTSTAIWEKVLAAFSAMPDVDLAYPTTRFIETRTEAKASPDGHDREAQSRERSAR